MRNKHYFYEDFLSSRTSFQEIFFLDSKFRDKDVQNSPVSTTFND